MAKDDISLVLKNDKQLEKLFNELLPSVQHQIVNKAFKDAGNVILSEAKSNLKQRSKASGKGAFKQKASKSRIGTIIGVSNFSYKFLEYGTDDRETTSYKKKKLKQPANKGKVKKIGFFYDAVEAKEKEAQNMIEGAITNQIKKTVEKYNK
jgi:hypothetical protein